MALLLQGCAYSCALLICLGVFFTWNNDPHVDNSNAAEEQGKSERKHRWEKGKRSVCMGSFMFLLWLFSCCD